MITASFNPNFHFVPKQNNTKPQNSRPQKPRDKAELAMYHRVSDSDTVYLFIQACLEQQFLR